MQELESHEDHQHSPYCPRDITVEDQEIFADIASDAPQRQEHENRANAERDRQLEDVDWRQLGVSAGQVSDQPEAQDAVARTDAGNQAEDEDASE